MRFPTLLSLAPLAAFLSTIACSGVNEPSENGDGDSSVGAAGNVPTGTGGATTDPNDPNATGGAGTVTDPNANPACPMMCEVTETIQVPVEGGGPMCTAEEYVPGQGYIGGSVVAFEGAEYTANYWTDISPAIGASDELGSPWAPGVPCPGSGDATEEMTVTTMVCCEAQPTDAPEPTQTCPLDAILGEAEFNAWFSAR